MDGRGTFSLGACAPPRHTLDDAVSPSTIRLKRASTIAEIRTQATRADRKRIKELERELLRKDRALAETAALLVLSKKVQAIFNKGEDE